MLFAKLNPSSISLTIKECQKASDITYTNRCFRGRRYLVYLHNDERKYPAACLFDILVHMTSTVLAQKCKDKNIMELDYLDTLMFIADYVMISNAIHIYRAHVERNISTNFYFSHYIVFTSDRQKLFCSAWQHRKANILQ